MTNCARCGQPLAEGAAFCGNCGQPAAAAGPQANTPPPEQLPSPASSTSSMTAQVLANQPAEPQAAPGFGTPMAAGAHYGATPIPLSQPAIPEGETKAILSLIFGVLGLPGALLPIAGLALGILGIVFGTLSHRSQKHRLSTIGIVVSSLAIVASLGVWAYNINWLEHHGGSKSAGGTHLNGELHSVTTPCYSVNLDTALKVANSTGSCSLEAYDGATLETSTMGDFISAATETALNASNFGAAAKQGLEQAIHENFPSATITNEFSNTFAASSAYYLEAHDTDTNKNIGAYAVLHQTGHGENLFIILQAKANNGTLDMSNLQSNWQWN